MHNFHFPIMIYISISKLTSLRSIHPWLFIRRSHFFNSSQIYMKNQYKRVQATGYFLLKTSHGNWCHVFPFKKTVCSPQNCAPNCESVESSLTKQWMRNHPLNLNPFNDSGNYFRFSVVRLPHFFKLSSHTFKFCSGFFVLVRFFSFNRAHFAAWHPNARSK